jgi:signal transduction histidine kinase
LPQEIIGSQEKELYLIPEERDRLLSTILARGFVENFVTRFKRKGGSVLWVSVNATLNRDEEGNILGIDGMARNITEHKREEAERIRMEQRLQQAQKAESLGRMAGAIAHNFNNILGAAIGNLDLAMEEVSEGSDLLKTYIKEAMNGSRRAAKISRFMLTYLGQTAGKAEPIDAARAMREASSLLNATIPANVDLRAELPSRGPIIRADGAHLTQILTNLITNAVEAIGEREGEITLTIDVLQGTGVQELKLTPPGWKPKAKEYVCLSIADTGHGIDPENLDKVFDPFFSTRFSGRGLGLSVVSGLLRALEGAISVDSHPGQGATFKVLLPLSEEERLVSSKDEALVGSPIEGMLPSSEWQPYQTGFVRCLSFIETGSMA